MSTGAVSSPDTEDQPETSRSGLPEQRARSVRRLALSGATFVAVGFGAGQLIKLASSIILTRLIHPEVYGLMDLAVSCMIGIHLFSDLGLIPCVVQSKRGEDPAFLRTAWTVQILRGGIIMLAALVIAWPISYLYHRPILFLILPVIGSIAVIESFASIGVFVLTRRVERGKLIFLELMSSLLSLILTVLIIYIMRPGPFMEVWHRTRPTLGLDENLVWAVVLGMFGSRLLVSLLSYPILPGPSPRFMLDRESIKEILGFAKWVFFSTVLSFFSGQFDRFLTPKLAGFEASGLYGRALGLLAISTGIISSFNSSVIYPILGRLQNEGRAPTDYYPRIHKVLSIFAAIAISGLVATGPSITRIIYPAIYDSVGWLLQILALGAWFAILQEFIGSSLLASGRRRAYVLPTAIKAVSMVGLLIPCWWLGKYFGYPDLVGIVIGWVAINSATYISASFLIRSSNIQVWKNDLVMTGLLVLVSLSALKLGGQISAWAGIASPSSRPGWIAKFFVMGTTTIAIWGGFLVFAWRRGTFNMLKRSRP